MDCWKYEAFFVASILSVVAFFSGGTLTDWTGAVAVLFTFMHAQISFDFQDSQEQLSKPTVACYKWSGRYFFIKEVLWVLTFFLLHAWPLLVGTIIFATYPYWRKWFRARVLPH